jgi:capsular polysaccharide biosynthesis protein
MHDLYDRDSINNLIAILAGIVVTIGVAFAAIVSL